MEARPCQEFAIAAEIPGEQLAANAALHTKWSKIALVHGLLQL